MMNTAPALPPEYFFYLQYHVVKQRELELNKVLEGMGLTISKWRILSTLARLGQSSMGMLADFCAIDRTTLTRTMDQLVAAAYVDRCADPRDRRQTMVDLTVSGRTAYEASIGTVVAFNDRALMDVSPSEMAVLERLLHKVVRNVISDPTWAESLVRFERPEPA